MISLYILTKATEKIGLAVVDNKMSELVIDRPERPQLVGSIFVGKVEKIDKGLQAAFVDIGLERQAYLDRKELPTARMNPNKGIESLITEGQSLNVQVIKDAYDKKGARVTGNLTLPSQSLVYLPFGQYLATSKKLPVDTATAVKTQIQQIVQDQEGAIIRTATLNESDQEREQTFLRLRAWWKSLAKASEKSPVPRCLWEDKAVTDRFIRAFDPEKITAIYFEEVSVLNDVKARFAKLTEIMHWNKQLVEQLPKSIEQLYQELLDPVVVGKHGITVVIERTEAMTVIDVNSAGYSGKRSQGNTPLQVNLVAAKVVAEQLRLRNISGIITIDFLRMKKAVDRNKLLHEFKTELSLDRMRSEVYGFTNLGLVEMTRKREAPAHADLIRDASQQKNVNVSITSELYQLERTLLSYQDNPNVEAIIIAIHPTLYRLWQENMTDSEFSQSVYFAVTKGVAHFNVKLVGSDQLIADYLVENKKQVIDKVN